MGCQKFVQVLFAVAVVRRLRLMLLCVCRKQLLALCLCMGFRPSRDTAVFSKGGGSMLLLVRDSAP